MPIILNKALKKATQYDPTKETRPISLEELCNSIKQNKIVLPIFQTYIRWTIDKSIALFNFQLFGKAPVSPISINIIENTNLAIQQVTFIEREVLNQEELYGKYSVNDGQQRLTCNFKAYIDHEDFKSIVLDLTTGKFVETNKLIRKSQIPVGILYNKSSDVFEKYLKEHKELQAFDVQTLLTNIRSKFMKYYYTVNFAKDLTQDEQMQWFDVLNLAGSRVTKVMVDLTDMLSKEVDYYKEYADRFVRSLDNARVADLIVRKETEVSIPLATLNSAYEVIVRNGVHSNNFSPIPSDVKTSTVSRLEPPIIRSIFSHTLKSLNKALDFIAQNDLGNPDRIDYITYLTGFFAFLNETELTSIEHKKVCDWYENINFNNLGNNDRRIQFTDLLKVANLV